MKKILLLSILLLPNIALAKFVDLTKYGEDYSVNMDIVRYIYQDEKDCRLTIQDKVKMSVGSGVEIVLANTDCKTFIKENSLDK